MVHVPNRIHRITYIYIANCVSQNHVAPSFSSFLPSPLQPLLLPFDLINQRGEERKLGGNKGGGIRNNKWELGGGREKGEQLHLLTFGLITAGIQPEISHLCCA